jgi:hypothetical protein
MATDPIFRPFVVPSRFEAIEGKSRDAWGSFIFPVQNSLEILEQLLLNAEISKRGQFFIVDSKSGFGKTTFLRTANLFVKNLSVFSIDESFSEDLSDFVFQSIKESERALFILEGRESIDHVSDTELGELLHKLNQILRRSKDKAIVFAWPCNSSALAKRLFQKAFEIGGEALVDTSNGLHKFSGPPKKEFRHIVSSTLTMLNDGADVADLGIDEFWFTEILNKSESIGAVFEKIAQQIARRRRDLITFSKHERYRVWVLVAAG